jgi:hypothetical protein
MTRLIKLIPIEEIRGILMRNSVGQDQKVEIASAETPKPVRLVKVYHPDGTKTLEPTAGEK